MPRNDLGMPGLSDWRPNDKDLRLDGSRKGAGWLGPIKRPDGQISTEISVGVDLGGKEIEIPLMVPGLTTDEIGYLLNNDISAPDFIKNMPKAIMQKAINHA